MLLDDIIERICLKRIAYLSVTNRVFVSNAFWQKIKETRGVSLSPTANAQPTDVQAAARLRIASAQA